jgi:putative salt-induced outer membrane protein YdiY
MKTLFCLAIFGSAVLADTVTMKNGDRLSGTLVNTTPKGVVLKSEFAGEVTIAIENITAVETGGPVVVTTKDGRKLTGPVTTSGETLRVGGEEAPRAQLAAVRPQPAQQQFEIAEKRAQRPEFLDLYSGYVDFGFANTSGNASTRTLNTTGNLVRTTAKDKVTLRFSQIYANNATTGASLTTAQAIRSGIAYQRSFSPRMFVQGFNDYDYDRFLLLDLRAVIGGGLGFTAIKRPRTNLSLGGGGAYNREQFGADRARAAFTRTTGEAYFNQDFNHKLTAVLSIFERFSFFPNLTQTGEYRFNFDAGFSATLYKSLALQTAVSNRYLSNPPAGRKSNDSLFTTGIRYTIPSRSR